MLSADGFVWDIAGASDEDNGHCFVAVDLATNGLVIDTWALYGVVTPAAVAEYAVAKSGGQLFALLNPDQVSKAIAKAPNGMDWASLIAAFDAQGGNVAPIVTPPPPAPTPRTLSAYAPSAAAARRGDLLMNRRRWYDFNPAVALGSRRASGSCPRRRPAQANKVIAAFWATTSGKKA